MYPGTPLQIVKGVDDHLGIKFLAEAIINANPNKEQNNHADPFWDSSAISLLSSIISLTMLRIPNATFNDVLAIWDRFNFQESRMNSSIETSLDSTFEELKKEQPNCFALRAWKTFSKLPLKTASCTYSTLSVMLDTVFNDNVRIMIGKSKKLDFEKLSSEKTVLFVSSSPVNTSLNGLISIFYSSALKSLFEIAQKRPNGRLPRQVRFIADDFATGGRVKNFDEYASIMRESNVSFAIFIQSESQLESLYGSSRAVSILNNFDTYVFMGTNDVSTARSVSEKINRPLEDILFLEVGKEIIFRRGCKPLIADRYDISKDRQLLVAEEFETEAEIDEIFF